jgi:hypothetical protein
MTQCLCAVNQFPLELPESGGPEDELIEDVSCDERAASLAGKTEIDVGLEVLALIRLACFDGIKDVLQEFGREA